MRMRLWFTKDIFFTKRKARREGQTAFSKNGRNLRPYILNPLYYSPVLYVRSFFLFLYTPPKDLSKNLSSGH